MLELNPDQIFKLYQEKKVDKSTVITQLISIVEEYDNDNDRVNSLRYLSQIARLPDDIYEFFENLLLSDFSDSIRELSAEIIIKRYLNIGAKSIRWALEHEESVDMILSIITHLNERNTKESQSLFDLAVQLYSEDYMDTFKQYKIRPKESMNLKLLELSSKVKIRLLDPYDLFGIFVDFNDGYVTDLRLYDVRPPNPKWKFFKLFSKLKKLSLVGVCIRRIEGLEGSRGLEELRISDNEICEITGLDSLTNLKYLDLSNNQLSEIKGLENLGNLEALDLRGNQISEIKGLSHLKNLQSLYLANNLIPDEVIDQYLANNNQLKLS